MRTLLVILLLVCGCAKSQNFDAERKARSHDLRAQIDVTWKKIQHYEYMAPLWNRDRDLGLLEYRTLADSMIVLAHLRADYALLIDSLTIVEAKKNPDGSYGWPWPSPFETHPTDQPKHSPIDPDSARPSRARPPLIET